MSLANAEKLKQAEQLIAKNLIVEAKALLIDILSSAPQHLNVLSQLFDITLKMHDFSEAEGYLKQLHALISDNKKQLLLTISFLEAKEAYFELISLLESYLTHNDEIDLRYKLAENLVKAGRILAAEQNFLACIEQGLTNPFVFLNLGHVYKAKGESAQAVNYYRKFIEKMPANCGIGYWSLADLKDFKFSDDDLNSLLILLSQENLSIGNRILLLFAVARAHEQQKAFDSAFAAMNEANQRLSQYRPFKRDLYAGLINNMMSGLALNKAKISQQTIEKPEFTPIFIVGMPRSGTTLVEQILASHSLVESTDELQYIERIGLELEKSGGYVKQLNTLNGARLKHYQQQYKTQVQQYFSSYQPIIIDKNPNNFLHIGLIKTLYPNAKIINVVRNPLDNALSVFKQYFSHGHEYSSSLQGIALYWQGYLALMEYWKKCYGDEILQLSYEVLTDDPEKEIRRLLDYCQLEFQPQCLTFYQSKRVVLTPSVSQVRQPINKKSVNSWQHYQPFITQALPTFNEIIAKATKLVTDK